MKKIIVLSSLCLMIVLSACNSVETDELVDYHNNYVETVSSKAEEVDQLLVKAGEASEVSETYDILKDEMKPLVDEINQYIVEQKPKTDAVKEINDMRTEQFQEWSEAFDMQLEALEKAQSTSVDEEEVMDLMEKYNEKLAKATDIGQDAEARFNLQMRGLTPPSLDGISF